MTPSPAPVPKGSIEAAAIDLEKSYADTNGRLNFREILSSIQAIYPKWNLSGSISHETKVASLTNPKNIVLNRTREMLGNTASLESPTSQQKDIYQVEIFRAGLLIGNCDFPYGIELPDKIEGRILIGFKQDSQEAPEIEFSSSIMNCAIMFDSIDAALEALDTYFLGISNILRMIERKDENYGGSA